MPSTCIVHCSDFPFRKTSLLNNGLFPFYYLSPCLSNETITEIIASDSIMDELTIMDELINQIQATSEFKDEIVFVKFKYVEIRDLLKHFLTLISASLVFSVTFSEKIIDFQNAHLKQKIMLYASWGALVLSLGLCGYGLYANYLAAEIAIERINGLTELSFKNTAKVSYFIQDISAILYGLGLTLLVSTSIFKIKKTTYNNV